MTPPQTPVHRARPSPYLISAEGLVSPTAPAIPTKYTFLSTYVPPDPLSPNSIDTLSYDSVLRPYGLLGGIGSKAVLGLEDLAWIVSEVGGELEKRGEWKPEASLATVADSSLGYTHAILESGAGAESH